MNLVIDIGNTQAKLAVFKEDMLTASFSSSNKYLDCLPDICAKYSIKKAILSSTISVNKEVQQQLSNLNFTLIIFDYQTPIPILNLYNTPETLGPDRLAAAIGANSIHPNNNILVIDSGTALTYEFIDAKGCYHGGNISPGIEMRLKALNSFTDKLPLVSATGITPLIGNTTETAIRSGVMKGIEFEISGYIHYLKNYYPDLLVFLTGGSDFSFDTNLKSIIFADRFLVLKGLNRILNYNDKI